MSFNPILTVVCFWTLAAGAIVSAQEDVTDDSATPATALDEDGHLVRFQRDIAPILKRHCLECHGPEDAKNDFRVDDRDVLMDYIEPEDFESSTLFVDYLTIDDEDMLMPPTSHGGPLSAAELALIRVWIQEGADWPDDYEFPVDQDAAETPITPPAPPKELADRIWIAQGFLHPATVHFPIALFLLGGGFVVLGWKWPSVGTQIPLACLLLGTVTAIASSVMGWAFAPERGYGSGYSFFEWSREVDAHRWSAVVATGAASIFALIALVAVLSGSEKLTKAWKAGLLLCAAMIAAVGHQGGEMSYGTDFYPRAWRILVGEPDAEVRQTASQSVPPLPDSAETD